DRGRRDLEHRGRSDEMAHFVGLDVSVKETSVCVVDDAGKVILEQKVRTEPEDIIALLTSLGATFGRIGIEAGPLSQWLVNALTAAELPVICVETRHMKALLTAQQISKTDRNDARGIAQMMRVGLFKPVHVKTLVAQEQRMLLTSRKLLQRKLLDVESDLRIAPGSSPVITTHLVDGEVDLRDRTESRNECKQLDERGIPKVNRLLAATKPLRHAVGDPGHLGIHPISCPGRIRSGHRRLRCAQLPGVRHPG